MIDESLKAVNDSGFPLQIALQHAVGSKTESHGWRVKHVEHAWHNTGDDQSGFIDLVLGDRTDGINLVVECKRVRNANWLFMNSAGNSQQRLASKSWVTNFHDGQFGHCGWHEVPHAPSSPEALFCAIRGQSANDKNTLLERIGGTVVSATEALALEERDYRHKSKSSIRFYFNVIITTATLKVAAFAPDKISLDEGTIDNAIFENVPFVRMRKQFSMRPSALSPENWQRSQQGREDEDYNRENTVFVVRADAISDFLVQFKIPFSSIEPFNH